VWAFAQYIGDPGGFADTPPITLTGRLIATAIGILGIAIFAVPAGLIGSAFTEVMDSDRQEEHLNNNIDRIIHTFKFDKDQQHTNLFFVPRYKEVNNITARKLIPFDDILEAVKESECLHLYDLANAMNAADHPEPKLVVINYFKNRPYGGCIDRGSRVTIVSTSGSSEPASSWLAYHIAKLGGFNYIGKDIESDLDNPTSYYNIPQKTNCPNLQLFIDDLNKLASRPDSWVIPILGATGLKTRPTQFHFCYNSTKHDSSYNDPSSLVKDYETFDTLYNQVEQVLKTNFDYNCDKNEWYAINKENIGHHIAASNVYTLRVECFVYMFDNRWGSLIKTLAENIHDILEPERELITPPEMVTRPEGKDFGIQDYVD
jgi:voltage-gated potassium channel